MSDIYAPEQARAIYKYWPREARYFIVGGPADANEAQTIKGKFPKTVCVGFEPNKELFDIQKNDLDFPGKLFPYALWNTDTELEIKVPLGNIRAGRVSKSENPMKNTICGRSLDSLSQELGPWENVVIWLDIEGSEIRALVGAHKLLKTTLLLNLEVYGISENLSKFTRLLYSYGFKEIHRWNIQNNGERADIIFRKPEERKNV